MRTVSAALLAPAVLAVAGCASTPTPRPVVETAGAKPPPIVAKPSARSGGYYLDDGPGDPPPDLDLLPDAMPRVEKYASGANRPYNVFGTDYVPDLSGSPYKARGVGSWYGRKFHGQRTSNGEVYDMYAMTAAHPTLPLPCYALVTHVASGRSVIVRVNDRGPFLHGRIIDLSYAAAHRLGYATGGSALVEVEMLMPRDIAAGRIPATTAGLMTAAVAPAPTPIDDDPLLAVINETAVAPGPLPVVPVVPVASTSSTPSASSGASSFYLQLGAFRAKAGADSFAAHVGRLIDPALASKVRVSDASGLYRVRVGPYPQRAEADGAAASLRATIARPILVVPD